VELRDPQKLYNKFFVDDFSKSTSNINWRNLMQKMKVTTADSIIVTNPRFLRVADSLLPKIPVADWKTYLQWYVIKMRPIFLSDDFVLRNFEFNKVLTGQKQIVPRWQRASTLIDGSLGRPAGTAVCKKVLQAGGQTTNAVTGNKSSNCL
jgi:putative endopeptidase